MSPLQSLPSHLSERVRRTDAAERPWVSGPVVCWLHHAMRLDENPALDAARMLAVSAERPLVVVQIVFEREPYANDRHHTFILEGARDFARAAEAAGIDFRLHVERPGHRTAVLDDLGAMAGAIVTDDMPIAWWNDRYAHLERAATCTVLVVDSACVVSHNLVGRVHDRAYAFRRATETWRRERIVRPWPDAPQALARRDTAVPFAPVNLGQARLHELVASCAIDHSVAPVGHTRGGAIAATARWTAFRNDQLVHYARSRNDVLTPSTSRLSAYLNHGHISPLRVAREAALIGGPGVDKYLDELVIWRELAYAFARFFPEHNTPAAIPDWAKRTLADHAHERPASLERETLTAAQSGDAFWDAAQVCLVRHGGMHNNARMTWGKQILRWSPSPELAFDLMMELNDRYSLDGRSPVGYSGVLWCFGQFDHPVPEATTAFGRVRARFTTEQATVVEAARFAARVAPPAISKKHRFAVVGAGLAGITVARNLVTHGHHATIFEKSAGVGGRAATRRAGERAWDHGPPAFEVKNESVRARVDEWVRLGIVEPWRPNVGRAGEGGLKTIADPIADQMVAVGGMDGLARHLARGLAVHLSTTIERVSFDGQASALFVAEAPRLGPFDGVVIATPPAQAAALIEAASLLASCIDSTTMVPRWVALAAFRGSTGIHDVIVVEDGVVEFASRRESTEGSSWTIRATDAWSRENLEIAPSIAAETLAASFLRATGFEAPLNVVGLRWRYAFSVHDDRGGSFLDEHANLVVTGDWCSGFGVEAALESGHAASGRLLGWLHERDRGDGCVTPPDPSASASTGALRTAG